MGNNEPNNDRKKQEVFINSVVTTHSNRKAKQMEGCLSILGYHDDVERVSRDIRIEATNLEGKPFIIGGLAGLKGRAILHENDHLNQILFTDLIPNKTDQCKKWLEYLEIQHV